MHAEASATQKIEESVLPLGTNNRVELAILRCASKTVGKIIDSSDLSHRGRTADCTNERLWPSQQPPKSRSIESSALVHCPHVLALDTSRVCFAEEILRDAWTRKELTALSAQFDLWTFISDLAGAICDFVRADMP